MTPLAFGVVDRRALAGEIGQHDQPARARRRGLRLPRQPREGGLRIEFARRNVAEPVGQRAAGRKPGHRGVLAGKQPGRIPQARILDAGLRQHDGEDGRAVHQHHVAGAHHADAERLGGGVDRAGDDRRARRKAGGPRCLPGDMAGDVGRPDETRQALDLDDVGRQLGAPLLSVDQRKAARNWPPNSGR